MDLEKLDDSFSFFTSSIFMEDFYSKVYNYLKKDKQFLIKIKIFINNTVDEEYYNFINMILWPVFNLKSSQLKDKTYKDFGIDLKLLVINLIKENKLIIDGFEFKEKKLFEIYCSNDYGISYVFDGQLNLKKIKFLDNSEIEVEIEKEDLRNQNKKRTRKRIQKIDKKL